LPGQQFGLFSCTPPAFIRQHTQSACDSSQGRIFKRGPEVTGNMIFTKRPTPSCDPTFIAPGTAAFSLGEEIPAASFVKATRTPQPPAAGDLLQAIYLEAEDGARQPTGWQPVGGSENCRLLTLTDQRLHCLTATGRAGSTFADASCTEPAVYVSSCGPVPMFAERPEPMTCPPVYSVRTVGQRLDRVYTTLYTGSCMETSSTAYYAQGNSVPIDSFPTVDETDDPAGRLRRRFRVGPGGLMMTTAWYDSDRATLCRPSPVGDKLRCIPEGPGLSIFFADGACAKPVAVAERWACKPRFTFDYDRLACPLRTRAFEVGAAHDGPVFELQTDRSQNPPRESCLPVTERRPDYAYYQVKEIPEADLPELQSLVE
jgi:hypothetical protein